MRKAIKKFTKKLLAIGIAAMYGPTVGDKVRLADTSLVIELKKDYTTYGDEVKFGGGKSIRDGMGQSVKTCSRDGDLDLVITNALIVDAFGIVKADIGIKEGKIAGIGKAGNPDVMDGVTTMIGGRTIHAYHTEGAGGCPHTAIREDASMNLEAVDEMMERFPDMELLFIESGGDNLSATFSPELVDATIFVIDVAEGDKIPRKGGPGITRSDLLIINKIDLAPYVGASLEVMERDSKKMRGERPFLFTNIRGDVHVDDVVSWIKENVLLEGM